MSIPRHLEFLLYTDPLSGVRAFSRESCLLVLGVGLEVVVVVLVMPLLSMCSLYVLAVLSMTLPVELCNLEPLAG